MRRFFLCLCVGMFSCLNVFSEDGNIFLRIDKDKTSIEEFEHCYLQAYPVTKISEEHFLTHFLCFKLKVADAKSRGWDTLPDFRLQCRALQEKVLKSIDGDMELDVPVSKKWVKFRQISIFLPQHVSSAYEQKARKTMDSVYAVLQKGASFDELSKHYTGNNCLSLYQDGDWIPEVCLVKEFTEQLKKLDIGAYSSPFYSPLGIHIVRMEGLKEEQYMEDFQKGGKTGGQLWSRFVNGQSLPDSVRVQLNLVADGLLAAYWDLRHAESEMMNVSDNDLQNYFEAHKKDYAWDLPHFKGGVIHCKNKKAALKLKKVLKKLPLEKWNEKIAICSENDPELSAKVETGLFQIGKNPYVDRLAFKCGSYLPHDDFPYSFVLGKRLKKGPENFMDVREEVLRDYRLQIEEARLTDLKQKFKIEINQDILKTVNCSGKK